MLKQKMLSGRYKPGEILLPLALFLLAIAVYSRGLSHSFLSNWDDNLYIVTNESAHGFSLAHLKGAFTDYYVGNYAPLHIVSYMLDYSLWGLRPFGYILHNILLHAGNGVIFYWLVNRLTAEKHVSLAAAFIFLFHPVQVESVIWISQRKNLLAMFFFLLALLLYTVYAQQGSRQRRICYALSVTAFILSLLTKSVAVILPLVLILHDLSFQPDKPLARKLTDKIPYIIAAALFAMLALTSQAQGLGGRTGFHGGTPVTTFFTMMPVLMQYLRMLAWPANLSAAYAPLIRSAIDPAVAISMAVIVLLALYGLLLYRKKSPLFFWYAIFFVAILPVSQIVPLLTLINDRYLYFPLLGAAAFVAAAASQLASSLKPTGLAIARLLSVSILLLYLGITWQRIPVWKDALTIWSDAVTKSPASKTAWFGLGNILENSSQPAAAIKAYERALSIDPAYDEVLDNISLLLLAEGEYRTANYYLARIVKLYPDNFEASVNLATSFYLLKEYVLAEELYLRALKNSPESAELLVMLANVQLQLQRKGPAEAYYARAVATGALSGATLYAMAAYNAMRSRRDEAFRLLESAISNGFSDCRNLSGDPDFDSVRNQPDFSRLCDLCYQYKQVRAR